MKLPVVARDALRQALKVISELREHISDPREIDKLDKPQLLALCKKLGVNVPSVIDQSKKGATGLEAFLEADEIERWHFSEKNPGFAGTIEFDLSIEMLERKFVRPARVTWEYTPAWEYYDLKLGRVFEGWPCSTRKLEILATDRAAIKPRSKEKGRRARKKQSWVDARVLLGDEVMPAAVDDAIEDLIDQAARSEDDRRRATHSI